MSDAPTARLRQQAAALFMLAAIGLPIALVLSLGRVGGERTQPAAVKPTSGPGDLLPTYGAAWPVELSREDGARLVGRVLDVLADSAGDPDGGNLAGPAGAVQGGGSNVPVFVTLFTPGADPVRAVAREATLELSADRAARAVRKAAGPAADPSAARVRVDVLREARAFPVEQRRAFALQHLGEPFGVALCVGSDYRFFLPAEIADYRAADNAGMLALVCRQAGLDPLRWQRRALEMWRLGATGFVNVAPGSRLVVRSDRGLMPVSESTVPRIYRAAESSAGYLVRAQKANGAFQAYWDAATNLRTGCDSVADVGAAAGAVGLFAARWPEHEYAAACYSAISYLMSNTQVDAEHPKMVFGRRQEGCRVTWELEASAQTLEALCRFRRAAARQDIDEWVAGLAEFLVFMQTDDGTFDLSYDCESGARGRPRQTGGACEPQAKAALALALAGAQLEAPRYLACAARALDAVRSAGPASYSAREARWLVSALRELDAAAPDARHREWAGSLAEGRRAVQLGADSAPAPDLVGASLDAVPPAAEDAANDLVVFSSACMMDAPGRAASLTAARLAAQYLMQLQFLPENSYYLDKPAAPEGGFREGLGSNIIRVQTVEAALRGLATLFEAEMQERERAAD